MSVAITVEKVGRRHYIRGNTYPIKGELRGAGCKWDPDASAWYTGKADVAESLVAGVAAGTVECVASYRKLVDGTWGVLVPGAVVAGSSVVVATKNGERKTETVEAVIETTERGTLCRVAQRQRKASSGRGVYRRRGTWTGCSCGSVEEYERPGDCASCRHDRY